MPKKKKRVKLDKDRILTRLEQLADEQAQALYRRGQSLIEITIRDNTVRMLWPTNDLDIWKDAGLKILTSYPDDYVHPDYDPSKRKRVKDK